MTTLFSRGALLAALVAFCLAAPAAAAPRHVTHEEAAQLIGHGVFVATGSAMPSSLMPLMREMALGRAAKTDVFYMATFASEANFNEAVVHKWHPNLLFVSQSNRAIAGRAGEGLSTLHRASLFEHAQRLARDDYPIDTVVVRVSPPDAEGYVSLGTTSDLTLLAIQSVLRRGGRIIAEENPNVPRLRGNRIPYDQLSYVVKNSDLLAEAAQLATTHIEEAIAGHVAALVPEDVRSTVQVGIGNALAGIGTALKHKPLDVWSEMGPAGLLALVSDPHSRVEHATFSFLHASNAAYHAVADDPRVEMKTSLEVNDPDAIAAQERMVAINTGLEVDFAGNVNAERDGERVISAPGGQPDFTRGASEAADGTSIIALRSTARGELSTIVPSLKGPTTTPGHHVDHVVTEWGATPRLRGLSPSARAYAIIRVADPLARGQLADDAHARGVIDARQREALRATIAPALRTAHESTREDQAYRALQRELIDPETHADLVFELLNPKLHALPRGE